jgi:hypothetical protein
MAKARTGDWVVVGSAALAARDELRATAGDFNAVQRAVGFNPDALAALDRIRGAVLASVERLRRALKDRPGRGLPG